MRRNMRVATAAFLPLRAVGRSKLPCTASPDPDHQHMDNFLLPMKRPYSASCLLGLLMALPTSGQAQWDLFFDGNIPVEHNGTVLDLAFAGGLNFVQISPIDLNGDGIKDLFLFDRSGNTVTTLLNDGTGGPLAYHVTREYDQVWPFRELNGWALLRDYDCDGKEDIFTYSTAGFAVYRNTSENGTLSFELTTPQVESDYVSTSGNSVITNLFVSREDVPSISDIDGDGDLDIITFSLLGTFAEYHKNLSMESFGSCDSLKFEVRNRCWGFFSENFSSNSVALDAPCQFNVPNPEFGGNTEAVAGEKAAAHAGSTLTALDLNGDGVMELLLGDIGFNNIVALYNGGTVDLAHMVSEDTLYPSTNVPVDLALYPAAYHLDIDGDGIRDLVVGVNAQSLAENAKSIWYYRNFGTDGIPDFQLQQKDLFQDRMLDLGEGAQPVLFDHNGDGLMDILVSNSGYYRPNGPYLSQIALLQNTGTATAPAFELVTEDYMGLSSLGLGQSMYPAFGDLDGDGDEDMLIGDLQGRLHFFRNIATGPVAQFVLVTPNLPDATGQPLDVGQYATPLLVDLDGDGLLDLIIGERNGNLNHYRNTGSTTEPVWTLISEALGEVNTAEYWNITGYSVPTLFTNAAGERELLSGSESGWLYHYGDIDNNLDGPWALLDSTFLDLRDGIRTSLALHDFTGDGVLDMVLGNYRGGLTFWRSDDITGVNDRSNLVARNFGMQPNPTTDHVELTLPEQSSAGIIWTVRNSMGQHVLSQPATGARTQLYVGDLAQGLYLIRAEGSSITTTQRLVVTGTGR